MLFFLDAFFPRVQSGSASSRYGSTDLEAVHQRSDIDRSIYQYNRYGRVFLIHGKSYLSIVHVYSSVHWTSHFFKVQENKPMFITLLYQGILPAGLDTDGLTEISGGVYGVPSGG